MKQRRKISFNEISCCRPVFSACHSGVQSLVKAGCKIFTAVNTQSLQEILKPTSGASARTSRNNVVPVSFAFIHPYVRARELLQ
jgi:hypothetical protein